VADRATVCDGLLTGPSRAAACSAFARATAATYLPGRTGSAVDEAAAPITDRSALRVLLLATHFRTGCAAADATRSTAAPPERIGAGSALEQATAPIARGPAIEALCRAGRGDA